MIDIKKIRLFFKDSQKDFAKKLELSIEYYNRVENGKIPLTNKLKSNLIKTFGVSKDYLDGKTDEPFPKITKEENDKLMYDKNFISMVSSVVSSRLEKEKTESLSSAPSKYEKLNVRQKKAIDKIIDLLSENNNKNS